MSLRPSGSKKGVLRPWGTEMVLPRQTRSGSNEGRGSRSARPPQSGGSTGRRIARLQARRRITWEVLRIGVS
jgi:hypothetical protein